MAVNITIRDVPSETRDQLAALAARRGQSMQTYLVAELQRIARRPSVEEVIERARRRKAVAGSRIDSATVLEHLEADRR